jgi:hypothetical protein
MLGRRASRRADLATSKLRARDILKPSVQDLRIEIREMSVTRPGRAASAPIRRSSSTTNRHPVVGSTATSSSSPANVSRNLLTDSVRRRDPRSRYLARRRVDPLRRHLRSMLIQSAYDRHLEPPLAPRFERLRGPAPRMR